MGVAIVLLFFAILPKPEALLAIHALMSLPSRFPSTPRSRLMARNVMEPLCCWVVRHLPGHCCPVRVNQAGYLIFDWG